LTSFKGGSFFEELITPVAEAYGISVENLMLQLSAPMRKYYLRVNKMKVDVSNLIQLLRGEGVTAKRSGLIEEAIYIEIKEGEKVELRDKAVMAEREAAERVMLGADLYMPGLKRIINARKGDWVSVLSEDGTPVAEGILEIEPKDISRKARGVAVKVERSLYRLPKIRELEAYKEGLITDQSYPSMLVSRMLSFFASEAFTYVDMTASPGGKIGHLYELTEGRGRYFAFDHTDKKVERLKREISRIGAQRVFIAKADSRYLSKDYPQLKSNFTLVDPPCSGLGNRPRIFSKGITKEELKNLVSLQRQLLAEAARITLPGGYISYSTCTITYEENEGQVEWALKNLPLEVAYPNFPYPQSKLSDHSVARFVPGIHDTIGFFAAIFRRI